MNVYKDGKLTPAGRAQMFAGESVTEVASSVGVSRTTAYKWWKRWKAEGAKGLEGRSSRPHRSPIRLPRHRRRQIERLRRQRWSTPRIARELKMPVSTVGLDFRRLGLGRLKNLNPPTPAIRYERDRPGELLHLNTKKLARIERVGRCIHGDRSRRVYGAGWEFLHVCVDDATRVTYAEMLPDERGETAPGFLRRVIRWFAAQGVPTQQVMTENGSCSRSKVFTAVVKEHSARHLRTRPCTPRTNGKAERLIRTAKEGWAYARPYDHSNDRTA